MLLVDTGVIVAAADRNDPHHEACAAVLETAAGPLITSPMVIAEAAYLINRELGPIAEQALYTSIIDDALVVETLSHSDWVRAFTSLSANTGTFPSAAPTPASSLSPSFTATQVATLDRRHFSIVRPTHIAAFILLP